MSSSVAGKGPLASARAFLLDGDGVLYRGRRRLPGARQFLAALHEAQTPFLLLTNNATKTPQQICDKLARMEIRLHPEQILTSAQATARWLKQRYPAGSHVLMIGMLGLEQALREAGFALTDDYRQAELVVVGMDTRFTYAKAAEATLAIRRGCPFIGTNPDRSFPSERGIEPGAGSILAMIETATDVPPIIIGKPQVSIFRQALAILGTEAEETVMVGDRYETDILGGHNAGLRTVAVLTGITTAEEFAAANPAPDWIFSGLEELSAAWHDC